MIDSSSSQNKKAITMRTIQLVPLLVLLYSKTTVAACKEIDVEQVNSGNGYQLVQEQLDSLQYSFMELFAHVKELGETMLNNQRTIEGSQQRITQIVQGFQKRMTDRVDDLESAVAANVSLVTEYAKEILDLQSICSNHDVILRELDHFKPNCSRSGIRRFTATTESSKAAITSATTECPRAAITSCNETNSKTSGLFQLLLPGNTTPATVYCEMESLGGGWLVFQQRVNGSVDFYRDWAAYRDGFGVIGEEFWLGLSTLHRLTNQGSYELAVELKDFDGGYRYAQYSDFKIDSEAENFKLAKYGTYSGTAGNGLSGHSEQQFSTFDKDNSSKNAQTYHGAWWYFGSYNSNLNGKYLNRSDGAKQMCWYTCSKFIKFSRMMIRKI